MNFGFWIHKVIPICLPIIEFVSSISVISSFPDIVDVARHCKKWQVKKLVNCANYVKRLRIQVKVVCSRCKIYTNLQHHVKCTCRLEWWWFLTFSKTQIKVEGPVPLTRHNSRHWTLLNCTYCWQWPWSPKLKCPVRWWPWPHNRQCPPAWGGWQWGCRSLCLPWWF